MNSMSKITAFYLNYNRFILIQKIHSQNKIQNSTNFFLLSIYFSHPNTHTHKNTLISMEIRNVLPKNTYAPIYLLLFFFKTKPKTHSIGILFIQDTGMIPNSLNSFLLLFSFVFVHIYFIAYKNSQRFSAKCIQSLKSKIPSWSHRLKNSY